MELSSKKIAFAGLLAMSAAFAAVTLSIFQGFGDALVDASQTEYVLEFSNSRNKPSISAEGSSGVYTVDTELGNAIDFSYSLANPGGTDGFIGLQPNGTFGNPYDGEEENRNRISGILGITVTGDFQEGGLVLYTGFDADQGVSGSNSYPLKSGTEANPNFGYSFFQIKNSGTSACSIDSVSVRYSCVVQDASVADLVYELNSERTGYVITGYTGTGGDVVIPSAYKGLPVISIGSSAFRFRSLTSIAIPSSVTSVGSSAFSNCTSLTSVTFGEGSQLESIGSNAFSSCTSLTSIDIPSSVTSVGDYAFSRCTSLTSIDIPSSVTSVGDYAFSRCTSLTSINIPSSITSIGNYTFQYCSSLTSIDIPSSVTSVGSCAFQYCSSLTSIDIPSSVTYVGFKAFYGCSSLTSVTFGESSKLGSIGSYAFSRCTSLRSIVIPSSVTSIGDWAFYNCSSLTSIDIPSSVTSIDESAFEDCSSLTSIDIPSSVTSIGESAFEDCSSLTSIDIPSSVTSIGSYAFCGCSSLTSVTFGEGSKLESIGYGAFYDCTSLEDIAIPSSVTSVGSSAFRNCISLTSIDIPSSVTSIGESAFSYCTSLASIDIPSSVTSIGESAFYGCSSLTSIVIPSSVTSIGESAFYGCSSLTIYCEAESQPEGWDSGWNYGDRPVVWGYKGQSGTTGDGFAYGISEIGGTKSVAITGYSGSGGEITIPASFRVDGEDVPVTSIAGNAFRECTSITSVTFAEGSKLESIGGYAFSYCTSLASIAIPSSVTSVGNRAFYGCSSLTIYCEAESQPEGWDSGWNYGDRHVVWGYNGQSGTTGDGFAYGISEIGGTKSVAITGYSGSGGEITIPASFRVDGEDVPVTSIAGNAFRECTSITSVTFAEGSKLESIGYGAFYDCTSLEDIAIPSSVTSVGSSAFRNCISLASIAIPSSVTSVGNRAFYGCSSLTIYCEAESRPSGWSSNWNPGNRPVVWGYNGQSGTTGDGFAYGISEIGGTKSVAITGYSGSGGEITIPASFRVDGEDVPVTSIAGNAFRECTSITSVTFGEGSKLESIGYGAFYDCTSLEDIAIPSSVTSVGSSAFRNCISLESIAIPSSVTSVGNYAFDNCRSLTSVTFGESSKLGSIGSYAFSRCTSLRSIVIPSSVTSIGDWAFYNCSSLTIYCEAASKPSGWDADWNSSDCDVYWGGTWSYVGGVPTPNA